MAGSKRTETGAGDRRSRWAPSAALTLLCTALAACSGGGIKEPVSLPPQTVTETQIDEPEETELPVATEVKKETLIVIEESAAADQPDTLVEAAAAEKERRGQSGESVVSITNENLEQHATGSLTFSDKDAVEQQTEEVDPEVAELLASEEYWRRETREARQRWRDAHDQIGELEAEIAGLRRRFYAEDDPFFRDSQIKPAWDRSLVELDRTRVEVEEAQQDLDRILEEGRKAGALPGWLREGIELEPQPDDPEDEGGSPAEPREPDVVDEYGTDSG